MTTYFWTVKEAANYLKITPTQVVKSLETGDLPGIKVAGIWRINKHKLIENTQAQRENPKASHKTQNPKMPHQPENINPDPKHNYKFFGVTLIKNIIKFLFNIIKFLFNFILKMLLFI